MPNTTILIAQQEEWNRVAGELEAENIKLAYYDNTLIPLLGDVTDKKILDYGAGPGLLAFALQKLGADVKVYDINPDMIEKAGEKIGKENILPLVESLPKNFFDFVICNLVLCIVNEDEVKRIVGDIQDVLADSGSAFVGFCNPRIFNVEESNIDKRFPTGAVYEDNHEYKKVKKEGDYEIIELHRPIEWYKNVYAAAGLKLVNAVFTPEYELNGKKIEDFVIFELKKV